MMPSTPKLLASLCTLLVAVTATAADDSALDGCWRSQQVQITQSDNSQYDQNGDCVTEYDGTRARSRCHGANGDTEILSGYEIVQPGTLRVTQLDAATGKPKGPPSELRYRIDDEWLLIERPLATASPAGANGKHPVSLKSVSIRVRPGSDAKLDCKPHGESPLRIGRTPVSSLALTTPSGWEPWLVDPASDKRLGATVNRSLFVGAFVPKGEAISTSGPTQLVIVLDDVRYGPAPVRLAEFVAVKKRFASELGEAKLTCDLPDRACAFLRMADGAQVYTELFNVKGRVTMISSATAHARSDSLNVLRKTVEAFVNQLRTDNAK
jgi:hypothetical protein